MPNRHNFSQDNEPSQIVMPPQEDLKVLSTLSDGERLARLEARMEAAAPVTWVYQLFANLQNNINELRYTLREITASTDIIRTTAQSVNDLTPMVKGLDAKIDDVARHSKDNYNQIEKLKTEHVADEAKKREVELIQKIAQLESERERRSFWNCLSRTQQLCSTLGALAAASAVIWAIIQVLPKIATVLGG